MTNDLRKLVNYQERQHNATNTGTLMHNLLRQACFFADGVTGNDELVAQIKTVPELVEIMGPLSRSEVPIAGTVNGRFISRRIDRLYINAKTKLIVILDYKTDIDRMHFYSKYVDQLHEYRALLGKIYPDYDIKCKILWTNDFTLENID